MTTSISTHTVLFFAVYTLFALLKDSEGRTIGRTLYHKVENADYIVQARINNVDMIDGSGNLILNEDVKMAPNNKNHLRLHVDIEKDGIIKGHEKLVPQQSLVVLLDTHWHHSVKSVSEKYGDKSIIMFLKGDDYRNVGGRFQFAEPDQRERINKMIRTIKNKEPRKGVVLRNVFRENSFNLQDKDDWNRAPSDLRSFCGALTNAFHNQAWKDLQDFTLPSMPERGQLPSGKLSPIPLSDPGIQMALARLTILGKDSDSASLLALLGYDLAPARRFWTVAFSLTRSDDKWLIRDITRVRYVDFDQPTKDSPRTGDPPSDSPAGQP